MRRVCLVLALAAAAPAQENPYAEAIVEGVQLYYKGKYDDAITKFARARQIAPQEWRGHTWQALTLIQQAMRETDATRRNGLLKEAESMTGPLVKQAGIMFQDPLRHYILGLCASVRGEDGKALDHLDRARKSRPELFKPYNGAPVDGIELQQNVKRGFARGLMAVGKRLILRGQFEEADPRLQLAFRELPKDDPGLRNLRRHLAVVDEALGRWEAAIEHLEACILLNKDDAELQLEFMGTIAQIYFKNQKLDKGLAVLAKVPEDSTHPEILAARCSALMIPALRDPEGEAMDAAIAYYKKAMAAYPKQDVYRLVEEFAELVLEKVRPQEADQHRALLDETLQIILREMKLRPECASLYFRAYRLHKLLGNKDEEVRYQGLHEQKKKEFEGKARFDERGRPRCR